MQRRLLVAVTAALALAVGAHAADAKQRPQDRLNAYTAVVDARGLATIAEAGFDAAEGTRQVRWRDRGRPHHDRRPAGQAGGRGRRCDAHPRPGRSDRAAVRGTDGGERIQRLALVRRAGRHPRPAVRGRSQQPEDRRAAQDRPHDPGPRDPRAPDHRGRAQGEGRQAPGGALQLDAARARVDLDRGQPAPDVPLHRPLPGGRQVDPAAARRHRAVVRPRRQPGRLPVHVRRRAAVAQEPARQRRRR